MEELIAIILLPFAVVAVVGLYGLAAWGLTRREERYQAKRTAERVAWVPQDSAESVKIVSIPTEGVDAVEWVERGVRLRVFPRTVNSEYSSADREVLTAAIEGDALAIGHRLDPKRWPRSVHNAVVHGNEVRVHVASRGDRRQKTRNCVTWLLDHVFEV